MRIFVCLPVFHSYPRLITPSARRLWFLQLLWPSSLWLFWPWQSLVRVLRYDKRFVLHMKSIQKPKGWMIWKTKNIPKSNGISQNIGKWPSKFLHFQSDNFFLPPQTKTKKDPKPRVMFQLHGHFPPFFSLDSKWVEVVPMAWCQPPGIQTKREVPWVLRSEAMFHGAVWILEIFTKRDREGFNWGNLGLFFGISCFELETWEPDHYHGVSGICCICLRNIAGVKKYFF